MAIRGPYQKRDIPRPPLAEYLVSIRIKAGLTQQDIAKKMSATKGSVCRIENGGRQKQCLNGYILYQLAEAYGAPITDVLKKANWPQPLLIGASEKEKQRIIKGLKEII